MTKKPKSKGATVPTTSKEPESLGRGNSMQFGFRLEWKIKPGSTALASLWGSLAHPHSERWTQGPYRVGDFPVLPTADGRRVICPHIAEWDQELAKHDLVREDVALAILACFKTSLPKVFFEHVDWRIAEVKLKMSHELTRVE